MVVSYQHSQQLSEDVNEIHPQTMFYIALYLQRPDFSAEGSRPSYHKDCAKDNWFFTSYQGPLGLLKNNLIAMHSSSYLFCQCQPPGKVTAIAWPCWFLWKLWRFFWWLVTLLRHTLHQSSLSSLVSLSSWSEYQVLTAYLLMMQAEFLLHPGSPPSLNRWGQNIEYPFSPTVSLIFGL